MASAAAAFVVSMVAGWAATTILRPTARRLRILDWADGARKLHVRPVPLLGGVAVCLGIAAGMAAWAVWPAASETPRVIPAALLSAAAAACGVGFVDDRRGLRVRYKLSGQLVAAAILAAATPAFDSISICGWELPVGWLAAPLAVGWYVAVMNAVNFLDGADGVAAGSGIATCIVAAILAAGHGELHTLAVAGALGGSLAGFLAYNRPPASIYLGDAGSLAVGLVLAECSLRSGCVDGVLLPVVPLALVAVPLVDLLLAVARRTLRGRCFWVADREHVHHRLLDAGWSPRATAGILFALSLAGGAAAALAVFGENDLWVVAAGVIFAISTVRMQLIGHVEWRLIRWHAAVLMARLAGRPSVAFGKRELLRPAWPHIRETASASGGTSEREERPKAA